MNDIELESPLCPLCGKSDSELAFTGPTFAPYAIRTCGCGMSFLSPRPTESAMLALYQQDHYFSADANDNAGYANYADQELALRATFKRLLQNLAALGKTGGALLEIGCGYGYLLDEARPYFSRRVGTDFSSGAVAQAGRLADQVYHGGIGAVDKTELFDCIIATHVIEHVYQPHQFISNLKQHLKPGGCILIAAPDMGSFWRKLMGRRWPSFKLPEHVLYFDAHTLKRLLQDCGLQQVQAMPFPHAFPLPLIASKLSLPLPAALNRFSFWIPATTVAMLGSQSN